MSKQCNWCSAAGQLVTDKLYCTACAAKCYRECIRCHRPFPNKCYFRTNNKRCVSCQKKYLKERLTLSCKKNYLHDGANDSVSAQSLQSNNLITGTMNNIVEYRLLSNKARVPTKATPGSVGYDLYSAESVKIEPGTCAKISTDLTLTFPPNCYGRIADRSGIATNFHLHVLGGVVDPDYQGIVKVVLFNLGPHKIHIIRSTRIAQIIFEKVVVINEFRPTTIHPAPTERGNNGFGSTGDSN